MYVAGTIPYILVLLTKEMAQQWHNLNKLFFKIHTLNFLFPSNRISEQEGMIDSFIHKIVKRIDLIKLQDLPIYSIRLPTQAGGKTVSRRLSIILLTFNVVKYRSVDCFINRKNESIESSTSTTVILFYVYPSTLEHHILIKLLIKNALIYVYVCSISMQYALCSNV